MTTSFRNLSAGLIRNKSVTFLLYTPLEMRIRPQRSVRKRCCSFSFAEHFSLEFYRIQLQSYRWDPSQLVWSEASLVLLLRNE